MKKRKLISSVMVPLMVLSLFPTAAFADTPVKYKDGTYTGTATVKGTDDFEDYGLTVEVSVSDGKITGITPQHNGSSYSEDNDPYWNWAVNGRTRSGKTYEGAVKQIINNQTTSVDAVSGATRTTNAIAEAVEDALSNAVSSDIYVLMNIPYDKFYQAEGTTNFDVDAISSATNKVGNYGKAGGAYHSGKTAASAGDGTVTAVGGENGAHLEGVTWPVKVSDLSVLEKLGGTEITDESTVTVATAGKGKTSSTELTGAATLTEAPAYSYYILSETPDYYAVLDAEGAAPTFSGVVGEVKKLDKLDVDVSYATHWGDVQFDFTGAQEVADKQVNAVVLTAQDGTKGGLIHLYNIWSYNSLAWNVANVKGLDGVTITNIRYYCNDKEGTYYVYDYPVELDILPIYTGEVKAKFKDESTIKVKGLPDDIKNPTATVYYTTGGKNATYEYLTPTHIDPADGDVEPDTAKVVDGKLTLTDKPELGKTYTVVIGSDNYVAITIEVEYKEIVSGYVLMNIPYDKFYGAEGITNFDADAISSATNKVGNYGKAGGAYHSGKTAAAAEDGTVSAVGGENGAHLEGVTWPVKVSDLSDLEELGGTKITDESKVTVATAGKGKTSSEELTGAAALTEAASYSYYILSEAPDYYVVLDADGDTPEFSGVEGTVKKLDKLDVDVSYATHWGDIQFDFDGAEEVADKQVNAVVLTTKDGTQGGLIHLYNIWSYNSLAWNVANVKGLDGVTITNIRYYCNDKKGTYYVYDYPVELDILPVYTGEVKAEFADDSTITVTGLPKDIKNPTAKVYYTSGERGAANEYLTPTHIDPDDGDVEPDTVEVVDGKITLANKPEDGKTYIIVIGSENYVAITVKADYTEKKASEDDNKSEDSNNNNPGSNDNNPQSNNSSDNKVEYKIVSDANGNGDSAVINPWKQGSEEGLLIVSEAPFDKFEGVLIDGQLVDPSNYTAASGSTRITLKKEFLDTVAVGTHDIIIRSTDGDAKTTFTVVASDTPATPNNNNQNNSQPSIAPKTGDNTDVWGLFSIIIAAVGVFSYTLKLKKKETE